MARESATNSSHRLKASTPDRGLFQKTRLLGLGALGVVFTLMLVACGGEMNSGVGIADSAGADSPEGLASDFTITLYTGTSQVGGDEINFSDLRGKPVVLNFWAGLCGPCRAEMPEFQEFHQEFADRVTLMGVDVGQFTGLGNHSDAADLLDSLMITYPTGYTGDASVMQEYGVLVMPTTVFITSEGKIFRKWSSALPREKLVEITSEMLAQERE